MHTDTTLTTHANLGNGCSHKICDYRIEVSSSGRPSPSLALTNRSQPQPKHQTKVDNKPRMPDPRLILHPRLWYDGPRSKPSTGIQQFDGQDGIPGMSSQKRFGGPPSSRRLARRALATVQAFLSPLTLLFPLFGIESANDSCEELCEWIIHADGGAASGDSDMLMLC